MPETITIHPAIERVNELLAQKSISARRFAKDLTHYLGEPENFDGFYQRHNRLLKGEYQNLSEEEAKAYRQWAIMEASTHQIGKTVADFVESKPHKKIEQAQKWLSSGIFNPTKARRLTGKLKALIKEIQAYYE